jgi:hypothetical protein
VGLGLKNKGIRVGMHGVGVGVEGLGLWGGFKRALILDLYLILR